MSIATNLIIYQKLWFPHLVKILSVSEKSNAIVQHFWLIGLPQIAERRKLVSSIKSSIINPEDDEVSYEGRGKSSPKVDLASAGNNTGDNHYSSIPSSNFSPLAIDEVPESPHADFGSSFDEVKQESEKLSLLNSMSSDGDSTKQFKGTNSETVWSDGLPSFLSSASKSSSVGDEIQEISETGVLKEADDDANVPVIEDVKPPPPPLAGANVMNIILVAAECAPWSKTGTVL